MATDHPDLAALLEQTWFQVNDERDLWGSFAARLEAANVRVAAPRSEDAARQRAIDPEYVVIDYGDGMTEPHRHKCGECGLTVADSRALALVAEDAAPLREALAEKGTIYESVLLDALGAIADADHPGSEDGAGKWRCRCEAHRTARDLLAGSAAQAKPEPGR